MSLNLLKDQTTLSKREKQENFKKSLDDQLRMKQEAASLKRHMRDHTTGDNRCVPGLDKPDFNRIPGLDRQQQETSNASGSDGAFSPQEKQPYMSALSEMNGRSQQVRQQQFEKESRYRNMLKDQIEENRRRKAAERAKLEEEKRRELAEIRRLQVDSAPRRQQLAQFQESPDHPLPSSVRLPPARHHGRHGKDDVGAYGQEGEPTPAYDSLSQYQKGMSTATGKTDVERDEPAREGISNGSPYHNGVGQHRGLDMQPRARRASSPGYIPEQHLDVEIHAPYNSSTGSHGYGQGVFERDPRVATSNRRLETELVGDEDTLVGKAALGDRGLGTMRDNDVVPRADFDELSNLCRDLLLEQKKLRRRLEEREEEESRAERLQQRDYQNEDDKLGESRQQGLGSSRPGAISGRDVRKRSVRQGVQGETGETSARGNGMRESGMRRDSKDKSRVAFGSTVPRSGQPRAEGRPRGAASSTQVSRRGRDPRISKSEARPRLDEVGVRYSSSKNVASINGASGRESFANRRSLDSDWRSHMRGTARRSLVDQDHSPCGWAPHEEQGRNGHRSQHPGRGDRGTIHDLLGRSPVRQASSRHEAEGGDELGGESKFLSANPF